MECVQIPDWNNRSSIIACNTNATMNYSYLTKIGHNEFRIDFKTTVNADIEKTVVVDGETYTRTIPHRYELDSVQDFENAKEPIRFFGIMPDYTDRKGYWLKEKVSDFECINGETYYVWNYHGFYTDPTTVLRESISQNGYINLLYAISKKTRIKGVSRLYTDKKHSYYQFEMNQILRRRLVAVPICNYGYNNTLYAEMNLFSFIKLNFGSIKYKRGEIYKTELYQRIENLVNNYPDIFPKKLLKGGVSELEYNDIAINFLNKSINYKFSNI